jgi:hypothetical protein
MHYFITGHSATPEREPAYVRACVRRVRACVRACDASPRAALTSTSTPLSRIGSGKRHLVLVQSGVCAPAPTTPLPC